MALPDVSTFLRTPGSGESIGGVQYDDPVIGTTIKLETFSNHGFPILLFKIGHQLVAANVGKEFPDDGTGILPTAPTGGGNNTLKLASGVLQTQQATLDPRGLLVVIVSGTGVGQVRQITGWTSGTQTITVNSNWTTNPLAADKYRLLIDCRRRSNVHLTTEYSTAPDASAAAFNLIFYDWGLSGAAAGRQFRRLVDLTRMASYQTFQITDAADIDTNNQYPGAPISVSTKGMLGCKARFTTATATGATDVFLGAT